MLWSNQLNQETIPHLQLQVAEARLSIQEVEHLVRGRVQVLGFQNHAGDHPLLARVHLQPGVPEIPTKKKQCRNERHGNVCGLLFCGADCFKTLNLCNHSQIKSYEEFVFIRLAEGEESTGSSLNMEDQKQELDEVRCLSPVGRWRRRGVLLSGGSGCGGRGGGWRTQETVWLLPHSSLKSTQERSRRRLHPAGRQRHGGRQLPSLGVTSAWTAFTAPAQPAPTHPRS